MAIPKIEVDRRMDRIEKAISTMAMWLVQAQTGFNAHDAQGIEKILKGEDVPEDRSSSPSEDSTE